MSAFIEFMGHDLINALGWTFIHTLWQGCLIALGMIIALQNIPARNATLRYSVAAGSMLTMLIAAVATFALIYYQPGQTAAVTTGVPAVKVVTPDTTYSLADWLRSNMSMLVIIWVVGVAILTLRLVFGLTYIHHLRSSAEDLTYRLGGKAKEIADCLKYEKSLLLGESPLVTIPIVVGYIKPMILFPIGAVNQLSNDEIEAVLAHEIAHLVRNDFIQNLIQSAIEILFYYHPAVWWISAVMRAERENCCDDLAVQVCGNSLTYARALVRLEEVGRSAPALALPFSGSKGHLLNRVKRILNQPQNKSNLMEKITATSLLLLCLILASFSNTERSKRPEVNVPQMIHAETQSMFVANYVNDTIIPRVSMIITQEDDGQEVKAEYENGKLKKLTVDGEEIAQEDFGQYENKLMRMRSAVPAPPAPPTAPGFPAVPAPPAPTMAPMPPLPPMPPMPDMPAMPPMPEMPPMPDMSNFEFDFDFPESEIIVEFAPHASDVVRSESVIIREVDENGKATYRVEGSAGETTIEIDSEAGIAIVDGERVTLDSDSIFVIEEVETSRNTVNGYFLGGQYDQDVVIEWDSATWAQNWNWDSEKWAKEWKESWDSEEWSNQWKEAWNSQQDSANWGHGNWDSEEWAKQWKEQFNEEEWKEYWEKHKDEWEGYHEILKEHHENGKQHKYFFHEKKKDGEDGDNGNASIEYFFIEGQDSDAPVAAYSIASGAKIDHELVELDEGTMQLIDKSLATAPEDGSLVTFQYQTAGYTSAPEAVQEIRVIGHELAPTTLTCDSISVFANAADVANGTVKVVGDVRIATSEEATNLVGNVKTIDVVNKGQKYIVIVNGVQVEEKIIGTEEQLSEEKPVIIEDVRTKERERTTVRGRKSRF